MRLRLSMLVLLSAALVPAAWARPPTNGFDTAVSIDALLTRGNANKGEIGLKLETQGESQHFEKLRGGGSFAYGQSEVESVETTTARRWELFGYARRPWDPNRTYSFADAKIQSDAVAELHYRLTEGGGGGVYLQKSDTMEWSLEAGLSWVFEETGDGSANYPAIRLGERYEREFATGAKLTQNLDYLPHMLQVDNFLINADLILTTVISKSLNVKTGLEYHFQSKPPEEAKSYDLRLFMGIAVKF